MNLTLSLGLLPPHLQGQLLLEFEVDQELRQDLNQDPRRSGLTEMSVNLNSLSFLGNRNPLEDLLLRAPALE